MVEKLKESLFFSFLFFPPPRAHGKPVKVRIRTVKQKKNKRKKERR
jgi:hypothetical protein